jgi:hypothetical protein
MKIETFFHFSTVEKNDTRHTSQRDETINKWLMENEKKMKIINIDSSVQTSNGFNIGVGTITNFYEVLVMTTIQYEEI